MFLIESELGDTLLPRKDHENDTYKTYSYTKEILYLSYQTLKSLLILKHNKI